MEVGRTQQRWLPGRQTLTPGDAPQPRHTPPAEPGETETEEDSRFDPVYDWFDLRRGTRPETLRRLRD